MLAALAVSNMEADYWGAKVAGRGRLRRYIWWARFDRRSVKLFIVAVVGAYGAVAVSSLPIFVNSWASHPGISEQMAVEIAGINISAMAVGLFLSFFLAPRWPLPLVAFTGVGLAIIGDVSSLAVSEVAQLRALRALEGMGVGCLIGATISWFGSHEQAARGFAIYIGIQMAIAVTLLTILPDINPGPNSLHLALLLFGIFCASLCPFLGGAKPAANRVLGAAGVRGTQVLRVFSVLALGVFNFTAFGLWSCMLRFDQIAEPSGGLISQVAVWASLCAVAGAALAILLSDRYGRFRPMMAGLGIYIMALVLFSWAQISLEIIIVVLLLQSFAWALSVPYFQAVQAALDKTGNLAIWGSLAGWAGAASGAVLLVMTMAGSSYVNPIAITIFLLAGTWALCAGPAILVDLHENSLKRKRREGLPEVAPVPSGSVHSQL
ncbi:hypothetical protein [Parvibaculum lavamentivorans]|nr:hypothetical protein [Parvibaculum lavamentivorans]